MSIQEIIPAPRRGFLSTWFGSGRATPPAAEARVEPSFGVARAADDADAMLFGDVGWSVPSHTGIRIDQQTAMSCAAVMACVRMVSADFAKLTPFLRKARAEGMGWDRVPASAHPVAVLLHQPNDWQTWFEFASQMQAAKMLRGNAYAVIVRDGRGRPVYLVPLNPDRVALWQSPAGGLFYMVTRAGLHELAVLRGQPFLIPAEDMLHVKELSGDGLVGLSPIALAREAIGLALGMEQQEARWMGAAAQPSGILTTDQKLTDAAAKRMADDWRGMKAGILNTGKIAVFEQGLKFQPLSLNAADLQFIASRTFQLQEIARIFRVPLHMIGEMTRVTGGSLTQMAQEYVNYTLSSEVTSHSQAWGRVFQLWKDDIGLSFDFKVLLEGDIITRYQANRLSLQGWKSVNEVRLGEGDNPVDEPRANEIFRPVNMAPVGSDVFSASAVAGNEAGLGSDMGGENPGAGAPSPDVINPDQEPSG